MKIPNTSKLFGGVVIKLKNELEELHKVQFNKVYRKQLIQVFFAAIIYTALGVAVYLLTANLLIQFAGQNELLSQISAWIELHRLSVFQSIHSRNKKDGSPCNLFQV